jgi:uncharacterized repeat protein (TIGR02543 family)
MKLPIPTTTGLAILAGISLISQASAVLNIDYVTVGNAGNANDSTGYGAVAYNYQIAKNEITIGQYAEFLNNVAKTDSYFLYNTNMSSDTKIAGITRSGSAGSYAYAPVAGSANKPITFVNWFDAARFCNWMHNGQGSGSTETGAYTLNGALGGVITKNVGATVWIPSEDEWYKAAYYDPTKGGTGGYWLYPMQNDALVGNTIGVANSANYYDGDYVGSGSSSFPTSNALTDVGAYGANSDSFYGTNDQGGNVWEFNDAVVSASSRGLRGGSWYYIGSGSLGGNLASLFRNSNAPTNETFNIGFRVARFPIILTITAIHGSVPGAGEKAFGSTVILTAAPDPGYLFIGWTGDATGTDNPLSVVMNAAKTITATFGPDTNDPDDDGLTNYQEIVERGTNPALPDTDGDNVKDGDDAFPLNTSEWLDTDGDGIGDNADLDDDGDGISDEDEVNIHGTNPKRADSDGDGLSDPAELQTHMTNPNLADTDSDGLSDGAEVNTYGTLPKMADTDGDGFLDGYEVLTGKSPLDILDKPALVAEARTAIEFTFSSALGKIYRIEDSLDLSTWGIVESGITGNGGQIQRFYTTRNVSKRYFRVEEDLP